MVCDSLGIETIHKLFHAIYFISLYNLPSDTSPTQMPITAVIQPPIPSNIVIQSHIPVDITTYDCFATRNSVAPTTPVHSLIS